MQSTQEMCIFFIVPIVIFVIATHTHTAISNQLEKQNKRKENI